MRHVGAVLMRARSSHLTYTRCAYLRRLSSASSPTPSPPPNKPPSSPKPKSKLRRNLFILFFLGTAYCLLPSTQSQPQTLNDTTFVPYTITSRTALSPSSFVITVTPQTPNPQPPYFLPGTNRWRHPLWSVEFKQPEVQISRHYTPLPPPQHIQAGHHSLDQGNADDGKDAKEEHGALRFYIRAVGDGEMSRYLNRLRESQTVHLRGPHVGFDLVHRLGSRKLLVFLAGGTGVVPGMQAARVALDCYEDTKVSLLWAVRSREEITSQAGQSVQKAWWDFAAKQPDELKETPGLSPVAEQLLDMKKIYGPRFDVRIAVDQEGTSFQLPHVRQALTSISDDYGSSPKHPGTGCALHDQSLHELVSEFEADKPRCGCAPMDGALPGKNLFIVSGPEGFVKHYAGDKVWRGGVQTQGAVGGLAGQLRQQNPGLRDDWLVLKL